MRDGNGRTKWTYRKGLHDIGKDTWAYLQPDGGWGWSNAGLIVDEDESLLVDTLTDIPLTREMLSAMRDATDLLAEDIGTIVNTHANGDHTYGNSCCQRAEIIASKAAAEEMAAESPAHILDLLERADELGALGDYTVSIFGGFDLAGVVERRPTKTFSGQLDLKVGDKEVRLIEVGPAHTMGDVLVHCPSDRTVFTGDILFIEGTPVMWAGPVANWLRACDLICELDVDVIVPGHGPITDKAGVRQVQEYLRFCDVEARRRYDAGMSVRDAAHDIALGGFSSWLDAERIAVNVDTLYREYDGRLDEAPNFERLMALMSELR